MSDAEAVPCPFCGSTNISQAETDGAKWGAMKCDCGAVGPDVRTGYGKPETWRAAAVEAWNLRAEQPAEVERLTYERAVWKEKATARGQEACALRGELAAFQSTTQRPAADAARQQLLDRIAWVRSLTLIHQDTEVREASLSYVKPNEYQRTVNALLDDLATESVR